MLKTIMLISNAPGADQLRRLHLKQKGRKNIIISRSFGYHGDDFVHNRIRERIVYQSYKKPRFIK